MELEIISMTPQERMYSYSQSSQIEAQTRLYRPPAR